jgi:molybdopterin synthase sulfur carrier subunit
MLRVRYWAGAREAAGTSSELVPAGSYGSVRAELLRRHGDRMTRLLEISTLLLDGSRLDKTTDPQLPDDAVLEVLPPFAGG